MSKEKDEPAKEPELTKLLQSPLGKYYARKARDGEIEKEEVVRKLVESWKMGVGSR